MSAVPKNLRAFAGMLESINEAIAVLDKVETMTAFEAEHAQRVAAMNKQRDDAMAEVAKAEAAVADAQRRALATTDQAKADGESILAKSVSEAAQIREAAEQAAKNAKARENASEAAERKAKAGLKEAEEKTAAAAKALAEIEQKIEEAKAAARAKFGV